MAHRLTVVEDGGVAGEVTSRSGVGAGFEAPSLTEATGVCTGDGGVLEIEVSTK